MPEWYENLIDILNDDMIPSEEDVLHLGDDTIPSPG